MNHTNDEHITHTTCTECVLLRKEIQELKAQITQLETKICTNTVLMNKLPYTNNAFFKNQTVDYLRSCDLDYHARKKLFNNINRLDFACVKYLMDLYAHPDSKLNWYEKFFDKEDNRDKNTLQFVTNCGSGDAVRYILDLWYTRDVGMLDCYSSDGSKIKLIRYIVRTFDEKTFEGVVVYALKMWARANLDLECAIIHNGKLIHDICDYCSLSEICCIFDIYGSKNLDIECKDNLVATPGVLLRARNDKWYKYVMERKKNIYEPLG